MSWLPDDATFHERVQAVFVAYRGRGVALTPRDMDLVDSWAEAQVPFEVVARGLKKAAETLLWDAIDAEHPVRGLRACRRYVDAEIAKYTKLAIGRTVEATTTDSTPFHLTRHKKLLATIKKLATQIPSVERLLALPEPRDFDEGDRHEALVLAFLLWSLPRAERRECLREARALMQKADLSSAQARRESLRFHRAALIRQRLELPSFW